MDGVLFDTERLCCSVWSDAARDAGYSIPDETFRSCVGRNDADTKRIVFDSLGYDFPYEEFRLRTRAAMRSCMEKDGPPVKKGAGDLLKFLTEGHIPVALATSTSEESARWMIERAGFTRFFSAFAFGSEVLCGKPSPEIFLLARDRLGIADSASCVVFEDSPAGIRASYAAGMKTVFVPDMVSPDKEVLDLVWKQIPDLGAAASPVFFAS